MDSLTLRPNEKIDMMASFGVGPGEGLTTVSVPPVVAPAPKTFSVSTPQSEGGSETLRPGEKINMMESFNTGGDVGKLSDESPQDIVQPTWRKGWNVIKSTAGVGVGTLNAATGYPFLWGFAAAEYLDPEQFYQMPWYKQLAVSFGGGFLSTLESIAKPGSMGTTGSDYYKAVTGRTIRDDLAHALGIRGVKNAEKWADTLGPMLTTTYDIMSDPSIALPVAASLARLKVPKGFVGSIPKSVIAQVDALNALDDKAVVAEARRLLQLAYDRKLWGIQQGESWYKSTGAKVGLYPPEYRGGIVSGETFEPTMRAKVGPAKMPGVDVEVTGGTRPPGGMVSGTPPSVGKTGMGVDVPREKVTIPPAAQRIMDAAKLRKVRYVQEGNLAKKSGVSALQFMNKARGRLGMPSYEDTKAASQEVEELYGKFGDTMLGKEFGRPDSDLISFDLGALVSAAKEVFGWDETLSALRVLELEDSAIGRTVKSALPDLMQTEGSKITGMVAPEGVSKVVDKTPQPTKVTPPVAKTVVISEPTVPTPPAAPKVVERDVLGNLNTTPEKAVSEDIYDILDGVGVEAPKPEPTAVPGETFRHAVVKKGDHVPGVGTIIETVETKDGKWWVQYMDDSTGKVSLKPLDTFMQKVKAVETPQVTLDMMGFQKMFDELVEGLSKMKAKYVSEKPPFQKQPIPDSILKSPGWDQVIKRRRTVTYKGTKIYAPEVYGVERSILMNLNEIPSPSGIPYIGKAIGLATKYLRTAQRTFDFIGPEATEMFKRPMDVAEHLVAVERVAFDKWLKELRSKIGFKSRTRIGTYAIAQQKSRILDPVTKKYIPYNDGIERLKAMGVTDIPVLDATEMQVYKLMRDKLDEIYTRLSAARVASGHKPFPKVDNYFTFMHDFAAIEAKGINLMRGGGLKELERYIHPTKTSFKSEKYRGKELYPLERDAFVIMERYMPQAFRHIHFSPRIAKLRELLSLMPAPNDPTGKLKWRLSETCPNTYQFISNWLDFQTGIDLGAGKHVEVNRMLTALNRNLPFALLSGYLRTVLIQYSSFRNTLTELGVKYMAQGVYDLLKAATDHTLWEEVMQKSNKMLVRSYDVSVQQAFDAIKSGRGGRLKTIVGRAGMKPTQWADITAAWATWRGAYRKGLAEGLGESKACNYADDTMIRTQGSGARSDISLIQQSAVGRTMSLLQTFAINDWDFLVRDVLGIGNPRVLTVDKLRKITRYVVGTTLINMIYEDGLQMNSPFGTPLRAFMQALDDGEDLPSASWQLIKELAENVPLVGGATRYGTSLFGPAPEMIQDVVTAMRNKRHRVGVMAETIAKAKGIPFTGQVSKYVKASGRGEPLWPRLAGKPTITGEAESSEEDSYW